MIIWGGVELATTDSWSGKLDGKTKITNALEGLGIALVSWLLLFTINPALVDFKNNALLKVPPPIIPPSTTVTVSTTDYYDNAKFKCTDLNSAGETMCKVDACDDCIYADGNFDFKDSGGKGSNVEMNSDLAQKLQDFSAATAHKNGRAVDFVLKDGSIDPKEISDLYNKMKKVTWVKLYYEAGNGGGGGDACAPYRAAPYHITCITPPTNTGKSFHVEI